MEHAQKCVFTQILVCSQLGNSHKLLKKKRSCCLIAIPTTGEDSSFHSE